MGRIDEEKACDKFEEEDLLFDKFKKRKIDKSFYYTSKIKEKK